MPKLVFEPYRRFFFLNNPSDDFEVIFDGPALEDNSIDAKDLASSILALGELIDRTSLLAEGSPRVSLRVKSSFRPGSFEIGFEVVQGIVELFSSKGATAVVNIIQILGVSGDLDKVRNATGFIQLILRSRGRPVRRVDEPNSSKEVVSVRRPGTLEVVYGDGHIEEVDEKVFSLYDDLKARENAEKFVSPLREEGIDQIRMRYQGKTSVHISADDVDFFDAPKSDATITTENENRITLIIISISFRPGEKWRVSDGGEKPFYVRILDVDFLQQVQDRDILFGTHDMLHVVLKTTQSIIDGKIRLEREIVKVLEYIPSPRQGELGFKE